MSEQESTSAPVKFSVDNFMGTWHIAHTTLGLWKSADKRNPRLVMKKLRDNSWAESVVYEQKGRFGGWGEKQINGTDTKTPTAPGSYQWAGTGILRLITSNSEIVAADPGMEDWAICVVGGTMFSDPGVHVLTRQLPPVTENKLQSILEAGYQATKTNESSESKVKALIDQYGLTEPART